MFCEFWSSGSRKYPEKVSHLARVELVLKMPRLEKAVNLATTHLKTYKLVYWLKKRIATHQEFLFVWLRVARQCKTIRSHIALFVHPLR